MASTKRRARAIEAPKPRAVALARAKTQPARNEPKLTRAAPAVETPAPAKSDAQPTRTPRGRGASTRATIDANPMERPLASPQATFVAEPNEHSPAEPTPASVCREYYATLDHPITERDIDAAAQLAQDHTDLKRYSWPIYRDTARRVARADVRREEHKAAMQISAGMMMSDAIRDLIDHTFIGVGGIRVTWAAATAADHYAYADMQRRLASGYLATAELHEEAARRIEEAGVTCLAEIPPATTRPEPNRIARGAE